MSSGSVPQGLLFSQIGYDLGLPMRAAVCGPAGMLGARPTFALRTPTARLVGEGALHDWGSKWGRQWWVIDFSHIAAEGAYRLDVIHENGRIWKSGELEIGKGLLWKQTFRHVALEQARKRAIFAGAKVGWFDAGMHWQECNSHCSYVIGMTDVLEFAPSRLSPEERELLEKQIINGCDYLCFLAKRAIELGNPEGSLCHEVPKWEKIILPHDAAKAVVAWTRAFRFLSNTHAEKKKQYLDHARKSFAYLRSAKPMTVGFNRLPRAVSADFVVPEQWATRDLVMIAWSCLELALAGFEQHKDDFAATVQDLLKRQIPRDKAEEKLFGHFYEFEGCGFSEKAWTHSIEKQEWGIDAGASYPNYLIPLIRACEVWPDHPDAATWRSAISRFAYGYLQPGCLANPMGIVPQGVFPGQGVINFAGLWHGMNAAYGCTAALAAELSHFLEDKAFLEIAAGNMQWIAGLNVGLTREALKSCVMFDMDLPEGETLPVSMIHGVGKRWAGGWTTMRGSICNGFSVGEQFKYDTEPTVENDAKIVLTDEDWITHSGAWLSGLSRLCT